MNKIIIASLAMVAMCGAAKAETTSDQLYHEHNIRMAHIYCSYNLKNDAGCKEVEAEFIPLHKRDLAAEKASDAYNKIQDEIKGHQYIDKVLKNDNTPIVQ